jgi:hypothetical protein
VRRSPRPLLFRTGLAALALLAGCRTVPKAPPAPPLAHPPALEKTFGSLATNPDGGLAILYKDLRIAVDAPARALSATAPSLDFLLLTTAAKAWPPEVRRDLKVLAPADAAEAAKKAGFSNAKGLATGQRLMLSKAGAFLFVSAVQQRNPATGALVNGYLLEFDNGRNVFLSGDSVDLAPMREFVYGLRDDGKELHLAVVNATKAPAEGRALRAADEALAAELASLLQPRVALIVDEGGVDAGKLKEAFGSQIFDGSWRVVSPTETVPF